MRIVMVFLVAATLVFAASAEHHKLTLDQSYSASSAILTPGSYKVVIEGDHATLKRGSEDVLTNVKVETNPSKYKETMKKFSQAKMASAEPILTEIDLGGTHKRLVFN